MKSKIVKPTTEAGKTPFKLRVPIITHLSDRIEVKLILFKANTAFPATVVDSCILTDTKSNRYESDSTFIAPGQNSYMANLYIPVESPIIIEGARLQITLFTLTGCKVIADYLCHSKKNLECELQKMSVTEMNESDAERFMDIKAEADKIITNQKVEKAKKIVDVEDMIPGLSEYRKELRREMSYLKENGGHQYNITRGRLLSRTKGTFSYVFEFESELYLSDDAPVRLVCSAGKATGSVLGKEENELFLNLDCDLGSTIGNAYITADPWKLLESLNKRLENIQNISTIAHDLITKGPLLKTSIPASEVPKGQDAAKEHVLHNPITVIWGPPGTGKTHTMAEIAIDFIKKGKTVLVVSHSNVSVDGVALKVEELLLKSGHKHMLEHGSILRYGYVRSEELMDNDRIVSRNYVLSHSPSLLAEIEEIDYKLSQSKKNRDSELLRKNLLDQKHKILGEIQNEEEYCIAKANLVATTISKVYARSFFENRAYDVVMFDEISMAYVPQLICAASHAREHFICVGDFRQLSPIVQADSNKLLKKDVFSFLGISDGGDQVYSHPWLVMLNEQRRMHPDISAFVNRSIYQRLLKNHDCVLSGKDSIVCRPPLSGHPLTLLDLQGTYCATTKNSDNSRFNILSAFIACSTAITAYRNGEKDIGIITPYAAQKRLIQAMLRDQLDRQDCKIACSTVHQFQGSERNLIIFDAVESYPSSKAGWLMSKNDNGSITRLVNVAVTRARGKFVAIAHKGYWKQKFSGMHHTFYELIRFICERGNVVDVTDDALKKYISSLDHCSETTLFYDFENAYQQLIADLSKAKKEIFVSIPSAGAFSEKEAMILRHLVTCQLRGISLKIKAKDIDSLPDEWQTHTFASDNAIMPLISIDKKIIWYGFPTADGIFKDGNTLFQTVLPVILRFTGQHTTSTIHALTALETQNIHGRNQNLLEKSSGIASGKTLRFSDYLAQTQTCHVCKSPMALARGRTGKNYLCCSNHKCANMDYLSKNIVDDYIYDNEIRCPVCNSRIKAIYANGIRVICDEGHFSQVDKI